MNVNFTEAKLFVIRYEIDQATKLHDILKIVIIIEAILAMKQIFDTSIHLYQIYSIAISKSFRQFFNRNLILFWNCFDSIKWSPHILVENELKCIKINPILPSRTLWEFSRKEECNSIICR